ncbi:sucrose-6-phosphate hydrolase [Oceanobacillus sp. J11TS1]|uniref:glycoside hydrolase family 32 protein n=1 Tax=Oceanobacillus sp. J11TS1 TaxID=2807191 RepID=UPI001B1A5E21|nr:sucrose-6-phosphate hydrolase [Oceanobacillus sp. J11TS1]GIO23481.1 sucrose-6-phosphate hydrolase [Oceanobacillus sp. J11TS1]
MRQSANELKKRALKKVVDRKEIVARDPYRLHFHIMPPVGLLNDPNGFVFYKGQYHMFYQWNPFQTEHGAKFWGHVISEDLVHWKEAQIALAPDQWYDKNGCYSGSAVVFRETLYVFYTGNVKNEQGDRESYQCLAVSKDGIHFEKRGPVIHVPTGYTAHFRDPKVFEKNGRWYMVLGAQTEGMQGEVVLYMSTDLENWSFQGTLAGSGRHGLVDFGYMWECPDLFELGGKDILLACPQGLPPEGFQFNNTFQSGYISGKVDYETVSFQHDAFVELDRGFDFYAPQTTLGASGRRILVGWMGNAEEEGTIQPTVQHEWIHALTVPRELEWKDSKLLQRPIAELQLLREDEIQYSDVAVREKAVMLPRVNSQVFELVIEVEDFDATVLSVELGGKTSFHYNANTKVCTLKRGKFSSEGIESRHCVLENLDSIQILKDTSSVEIFINNGEEVFTSRVFDKLEADQVRFTSEDGCVMLHVRKWNLKRVIDY